MPLSRIPLAEKFWAKVHKTEGCWLWMANRLPHKRDYGLIHEGGRGSRSLRAHRVSYELAYGPIPDGLDVLHRCDNPPCVRPDHLFLGTQLDNMRDMHRKGRQGPPRDIVGVKNINAKLAEADVVAILLSKEPSPVLAARYGVTKECIGHVRRRVTWKHVQAFSGALND